MNYATSADFAARYDVRLLGDLISDSGNRVGQNSLATNPNLLAILADASGLINSALLVSQMYAVADLVSLSTSTDTNYAADKAYLARLTCDLAFGLLNLRRGIVNYPQAAQYKEAQEILAKIKAGERVFNIPANVDSGLPQTDFQDFNSIVALDLLRDQATPNFFPLRRTQQ